MTASTVLSRPHLGADTALVIKLFSIPVIFRAMRTRDLIRRPLSARCAAASNPFGQPQTAGVASHIIRVRGPHHSLQLHLALQRGEGVQTFLCRSAQRRPRGRHQGLEADSAVYRPYRANFKENKFSKNNQFPSLISSSFIFAILSVVLVNFPPFEHSNF